MRSLLWVLVCSLALPAPSAGQVQQTDAGVTFEFVNSEVRSVVQSLAPFLDRPVVFGQINVSRIPLLQTARPIPRAEVLPLLRSTLGAQGLEIVDDGPAYLVRSRIAVPAAPLVQSGPGRGAGGIELHVIRLRHARAVDVAATVNALYGRASAVGELGAARPTTLSGELRDNRASGYGEAPAPSASPTRSGRFEGEVAIVPDARTNQLLIRATRADFELIRAAVTQVDLRPMQVMIQVTIAEVMRNSSFSYALSAALGARIEGSENTTVSGRTQGSARNDLEIVANGIGGIDLSLILRAGQGSGAVSILSRPIVFAANNERAEILFGDQLPFVQLRRTTDGGSVDQVVQYMDVGTRLSVLPTVSDDGYVQLQVTQEVNSATNVTGPEGAPVISTRSVETSLLVRDGQTAVLGGLSQVLREQTSSGIPLLSEIPLIGGIFGSSGRRRNDTELYLFLTPRLVRDDAGMDSLATTVRANSERAGRLLGQPSLIQPAEQRPREQSPINPGMDGQPSNSGPPQREEEEP